MNDLKLVAKYRYGLNFLALYNDRLEYNLFVKTSIRYDEIESVKYESGFGGTTISIRLRNGKLKEAGCNNSDYKAVRSHLDNYIRQTQLPSDGVDGIPLNCTLLGGSGLDALVHGNTYRVIFGDGLISIKVSNEQKIEISYNQLTSLKLEGPGRVTTDAGVMGGGFGLEGAILGIGAAALLNTLTTNTTTNTILYFAWPGAELFFHTSNYTPEEARLALSHAFTAIQSPKNNMAASDLTSQLERLVELKNVGALTDEEFSLSKAKLLNNCN